MSAPDTPIYTYYTHSTPNSVNSRHVTSLLSATATKIGFHTLGSHPHEIGTYSLQSGGAMTLHLTGVPDSTIKIVDRWRLDASLIYIQGQIAAFTKGVAAVMAKVQWFRHTNAPHASLF